MNLLLVMTDGRRECIKRTIPAALAMVEGIDHRVIYTDAGDESYTHWLHTNFPTFDVLESQKRLGFGGAIERAWQIILDNYDFDYVFHLEDDFIIEKPVDLKDFMAVLEERPYLQQMALLRQAWNEEEKKAGGIVQQNPDQFVPNQCRGYSWVEHRRFFTTNPSLYRRELVKRGWPNVKNSEGNFTLELTKDPTVQFGMWGPKFTEPWVNHIGNERIGSGY